MSKNSMKFLTLTIMMTLAVASISSAAGVGTTGAQFLKIGVGSRPAGMGGAFSALADDINAIYYNPAGLVSQRGKQASASYIQYFQGVTIGFLGYSQGVCENSAFGVGLNYLTVSGIERRATDLDTATDTFGANDMALYFSYANSKLLEGISKGLSFGANVKVIRQTIDTNAAQSFAADIATLYNSPSKKFSAAFGIYNLGTAVKFVDTGDPLPLDVRLGLACHVNNSFVVAADIDDYLVDGLINGSLGAEYAFNKIISARAGYKMSTEANKLGGLSGLGTGLGINVWGAQLDYAFVPFGDLSDTHRISISTKF